ncbi:hypothetical protein V1264_013589 [Littorina saxatilis]|uniref:PiggyBac transposable element-derived protein 4 C-terminal zinc-finger domain-containing protein n=1 Tax=Littorina saxatilis TaxID=31220 RepID=A0AAN9GK15_9CAEN
MDEDTATRFVSSLVKSIQALCNGYIDFSSSIEVVGHIHLNIDRNKKLDYVLTEEVSKSVSEGATVFASHSYHSHPPPSASSKTSGDASNQNRRKSQVSRDNDPLSITSLPPEVPNTSRSHSSSRVEENSDSSGSANYSQDFTPVKSENNRTSCQVQESLDRRRKGVPLSHTHRTQSPAAKRPRNHDTSSAVQNPGFDVIEIKEEPDDEPSVYFGDNSSSNMGAGQADIQTPDFSNVVMESLDRVGQIEGTQLVAGGDSGQQHQPFPVMLHTNPGMPSSSSQGPGPSLNPQSTASTSGGPEAAPCAEPTRGTLALGLRLKCETDDNSNSPTAASVQSAESAHLMDRVPQRGSKTNCQKRCVVCKTLGLRRDSRFHCVGCPEKPGLCRNTKECFKIYHEWKGIHVDSNPDNWTVEYQYVFKDYSAPS